MNTRDRWYVGNYHAMYIMYIYTCNDCVKILHLETLDCIQKLSLRILLVADNSSRLLPHLVGSNTTCLAIRVWICDQALDFAIKKHDFFVASKQKFESKQVMGCPGLVKAHEHVPLGGHDYFVSRIRVKQGGCSRIGRWHSYFQCNALCTAICRQCHQHV